MQGHGPDRGSIARGLDYYGLMSRTPFLMALALLAFIADAHAQSAKAPVPQAIAAEKAPERSALNASIFYQVVLAELSFNNGDIGAAYSLMLHAARESELHHRIGQLINQPATAEFVHPEAEVTEDLTVGNEPEVAIVQHLERAMIAHGLHKMFHGVILPR